jgi:hypothetical protein
MPGNACGHQSVLHQHYFVMVLHQLHSGAHECPAAAWHTYLCTQYCLELGGANSKSEPGKRHALCTHLLKTYVVPQEAPLNRLSVHASHAALRFVSCSQQAKKPAEPLLRGLGVSTLAASLVCGITKFKLDEVHVSTRMSGVPNASFLGIWDHVWRGWLNTACDRQSPIYKHEEYV